MRSRALMLFSALPLLAATVFSQGPTQTNKERERQLAIQAISTIRQVAAEAPLWNDKAAGAQVLADAADFLWTDDPDESAKWLKQAWNAVDQISSTTTTPENANLKAFFTTSAQSRLRTMVLNVARRHDRKLAEEFLKQLSPKDTNDEKDRGAFDDRTGRSEQLLTMAQQIVDSNPREAFALAQNSLVDGISYKLQNILTSLRKKDVQLSNQLFDLAVARFVSSVPEASEAQVLAGYLFQPGLTFAANSAGQSMLVLNPLQQGLSPVATSEPQRAKRFLIAVYERLLTRPIVLETQEGKQQAQQLLILGNVVARSYDAFAPDLSPAVKGFLAQLQRRLAPAGEIRSASSDVYNSGDATKPLTKEEAYERRISEMEEAAEKESNAAFRKVAFASAAVATKPEDYVRARRIAEKIDEDDLRADAVSFVLYRAALFFTDKADLEKAIEIVPKISDTYHRAIVKIALAQHLLSSKPQRVEPAEVTLRHQRVVDLLSDIDRDLKNEDPSAKAAKILLGRTAILARVDKDQALTSLQQAVQMMNKLDQFDLRSGAAPNLGISAVPTSTATVATPKMGFDFRSAIELLVDIDFEQVSTIAASLKVKELRGVARLEVAKLYLAKNRKSIV